MGRPLGAALITAGFLGIAGFDRADIPIPTVVHVYFTREGKPYNQPVAFRVHCYGWRWYPTRPRTKPVPYVPQQVYGYSGRCERYGCRIHHSLYLLYVNIDYCDLEGEAAGHSFSVPKFGKYPVGRCSEPEAEEMSCVLRIGIPE